MLNISVEKFPDQEIMLKKQVNYSKISRSGNIYEHTNSKLSRSGSFGA